MHYVSIDYVAEIRKDVLGMSAEKRVAEKYSATVPQLLNSQFPDHVEKWVGRGVYKWRWKCKYEEHYYNLLFWRKRGENEMETRKFEYKRLR